MINVLVRVRLLVYMIAQFALLKFLYSLQYALTGNVVRLSNMVDPVVVRPVPTNSSYSVRTPFAMEGGDHERLNCSLNDCSPVSSCIRTLLAVISFIVLGGLDSALTRQVFMDGTRLHRYWPLRSTRT